MHDNYLTVSALTKYIKRKFELDNHLTEVWLKGEISNFKHHSRGHMYMTMKDDRSRINAVMFAGNNRSLKFLPENGMQVLIKGQVGVYEPQGNYQLYIQQMEPDGIGALYVAFEQLKEKLDNEGLFSESLKKALPTYPKHIGVVTSPTGAAIRDILTTIQRRYPIADITIFPALVQGEQAPVSVASAIQLANKSDLALDVLIVGRGGGSIEELWAFNDERVARAVANSIIPVISGVGHETDVTITDFVADVRAATPTGAAEIAVPSKEDVQQHLNNLNRTMSRGLEYLMNHSKNHLNRLKKSYAFRYPAQLLNQKEQELDKNIERLTKSSLSSQENQLKTFSQLNQRLENQHPEKQVQTTKKELAQLFNRQSRAMNQLYTAYNQKFIRQLDKLEVLSPLHTMKRGYAITYREDGSLIQSTKQVQPGDAITVKVKDGSLDCHVWGIEEEKK
ncbi:exodeoxyribonuclease VII large subunit [Paraliobacillus ryukyuensis]|uniref:exodeoxyribonuclease VII large subunit n=1 Tax=Paraliobacillus ryukyuensis TaxID=200904 RepID=UPI0009A6DCEA|nr:exodeoxyribonuclease VII large subunit [Paraliobacillus ryukyuensis]